MNQFDQQWQKLTSVARKAGDFRDTGAPHGFATRVVARAGAVPAVSAWSPFEYFALRGLVVAAAFGLVAVAANYTNFMAGTQSDAYAATDPVEELLDLS